MTQKKLKDKKCFFQPIFSSVFESYKARHDATQFNKNESLSELIYLLLASNPVRVEIKQAAHRDYGSILGIFLQV